MTKRQIDINGFVEIRDNPISKAGIFEYYGSEIDAPEPNKLYRVLRSPDSLKQAVDKFKGVPIVNDHTMIGDGQTPPEKKGIDGAIGDDVYFKDNTVFANIRLYTNRIKDLITKGKKELSVGYWSQYEFVKGVWNGKPYDAIQHIVGGNHLALVDEGRMGSSVAVLDHKPQFKPLTITFDQKAIQMNEDEMKDDDVVPTEDLDEESSETDAIYESEEHAEKEMETLQSILDKIGALEARLNKFLGEEAKEPEHQEEVAPVEDEAPTDIEEAKEEMLDTKATEDRIAKRIQAEFTAKQRAIEFVKPLVGTADHSARSSKEVWQYAANKLDLKGEPETAVKAYAKAKSQIKVAVTQDSKPIATTHKHNGRFTGE